jgi:DNA polymerase-3 subunit gamma/tau
LRRTEYIREKRIEILTSLAIRYRPKTIADLRGQNAIERILSAAITNNRLSSAYILTGIRGVGKTTTARIIARSVNCQSGPNLSPCGECSSCKGIDSDSSLDVIEIDAASNTGVDQMRDLISSVSYAPMTPNARKIYIIDEVHMLSTNAFNALLKTLEEPPEHVMFILATTELQKIPATIQSRCQVLSLARISVKDIEENLQRIADLEQSKLQNGVASLISRAAGGSMRDAISMLDQSISGASDEVLLEDVSQMIGRASRLKVGGLARKICSGDVAGSLQSWKEIFEDGADPFAALEDLMEWIHQANVYALAAGYFDDSGVPEAEITYIKSISQDTRQAALAGAITMMMDVVPSLRNTPNGSQSCEITIARLAATFARVNAA